MSLPKFLACLSGAEPPCVGMFGGMFMGTCLHRAQTVGLMGRHVCRHVSSACLKRARSDFVPTRWQRGVSIAPAEMSTKRKGNKREK